MKLPSPYDEILSGRQRPPSHMLAFLPPGAEPPLPGDVSHLLQESTLDVDRVRRPDVLDEPDAEWEIEALVDGVPFRVACGPAPDPADLHADWTAIDAGVRESAQQANVCITITCTFAGRPLRDFHRQIRVAAAAAPRATVVLDASACRPHPKLWIEEVAGSTIPPSALNLYVIHSVHHVDHPRAPVWIHTHGLQRCGSIELEMLNVKMEETQPLAHLINASAAMFLETGIPRPGTEFEPGTGLSLTWLPWEEALEKVSPLLPGHRASRDEAHAEPAGILFAPVRTLLGRRLKSPSRLVPILENRPSLYVPAMETERQGMLARDRWEYYLDLLRQFHATREWIFLARLDYPADPQSGLEREGLWFHVHGVAGASMDATLINAPRGVPKLAEGERGRHPISLLGDWAIGTPMGNFTPDTVLDLLRKLERV